jgi:plastocyanin
VRFSEPGVYDYFCDRHPSMRGEIRVNASQP